MKDLIDIHSHILPGADDGSDSFETSMRMLRRAAADGISEMILTPHNKPGRRHMNAAEMTVGVEELQEMAAAEGLGIKLYPGSEIYYRSGLTEEMEQDMVGTLAGSRYVLVEFNPLADFDYIRNGIYSLLTGGYYPILAHVERYQHVCGAKYGTDDLVEMGCYLQVNAGSVLGKSGAKTKRFVKKALKQRQIHFIATDAHDLLRRPPSLSDCADHIEGKYGSDYCRRLFQENPLHVIGDKEIEFS